MTLEEFTEKFWAARPWTQNGTYPDWPYTVYQFIMESGAKRIIEIGCGTGAVTFAIALTEPHAFVGIDNEAENHPLSEVAKLCSMMGGKWHGSKSEDILPTLDGPFDLMIHDGEHTHRSVLYDCKEALRLGCSHIIVHDSNWEEVDRAIRDLGLPNESMLDHSGFPRLLCRA